MNKDITICSRVDCVNVLCDRHRRNIGDGSLIIPIAKFEECEGYAHTIKVPNKRPLYACDPRKNIDCSKSGCFIRGGECWMTTKKECACENSEED